MKKILVSLVTISAVVAVAVAATSAYFTSQSVLGASTIASGTLNVSATSNNKTYLDLGSIGKLAPGEHTDWIYITVKNTGNLNATSFGKFVLADDNGLAQFLKLYDYRVQYFDENNQAVSRWAMQDNYYGTEINEDYFIREGESSKFVAVGGSPILTQWTMSNGKGVVDDTTPTPWDYEGLKPGYSYVISFRLQMDPNATNTAQGKYSKLGYIVHATQVNKEAISQMEGVTGITQNILVGAGGVYDYTSGQVD